MTTRLENRNEELWLIYTVDDDEVVSENKVLRMWESASGWYWYQVEKEDEHNICFGYVQGFYPEWGSFSINELDSIPVIWEIKGEAMLWSGRRNE
jgi:hypothetical protein